MSVEYVSAPTKQIMKRVEKLFQKDRSVSPSRVQWRIQRLVAPTSTLSTTTTKFQINSTCARVSLSDAVLMKTDKHKTRKTDRNTTTLFAWVRVDRNERPHSAHHTLLARKPLLPSSYSAVCLCSTSCDCVRLVSCIWFNSNWHVDNRWPTSASVSRVNFVALWSAEAVVCKAKRWKPLPACCRLKQHQIATVEGVLFVCC